MAATISLGRPLPDASSSLPGDAAGRLISPYVALHQAGFTHATGRPARRALLPHDCTLAGVAAGGMFLWPCPWGRPHWALPSALPYGARTFLHRRSAIRCGSGSGCPACSRHIVSRGTASLNASRVKRDRPIGPRGDLSPRRDLLGTWPRLSGQTESSTITTTRRRE